MDLRTNFEYNQGKLNEATEVIKKHEAQLSQLTESRDLSGRDPNLVDNNSLSSNIFIDGFPETNDENNEKLQINIRKHFSE